MVSNPIPDVQPVTTATRPVRSRPSVTSSAVESSSNPLSGTPATRVLSAPHPLVRAVAPAIATNRRRFRVGSVTKERLKRRGCFICRRFSIRVESVGRRFKPVAEVGSFFLFDVFGTVFTALPGDAGVKRHAHLADMQVSTAGRTLVATRQRQAQGAQPLTTTITAQVLGHPGSPYGQGNRSIPALSPRLVQLARNKLSHHRFLQYVRRQHALIQDEIMKRLLVEAVA